ncbi:hypothetical protein ColLi_10857 [Colletotrichum liriopes]|uniref:Uncharacterized protein n=1 Tax=Colletotrichum liriopes TaxID=708192 RepID=A0AA37GVG7_9PEZI|nr:hypothetical protein ColLi_10857 [Colletotrichum liriopes]
MPSAEPDSGSLGFVLLAHTTRCIITILSHCIDLLHANVRLISLWFGSSSIAARLVFYSIVESCNIVSASTNKTITAWQTTINVFFWAVSYTVFLLFILPCAVIVVLLERCETVYLRLRSSRFEAAVREYLGLSPLGRPYLDQSGPSIAATGRILSVPTRSPSFQASTRSSKLAQSSREQRSRAQRFIKNITVCLLTLVEAAVTPMLPKKAKEMMPTYRKIQISPLPQKPVHLTLANQSYRIAQATNFISTIKHALLSKIVERWGRLPTPTLALRAFHLQMKPFLSDNAQTETKRTSPSRHHLLGPHSLPTGHDVSPPASPEEDLSPATQQSPAPASLPPQESQPLRLVNSKEYTHPFTGEKWDMMFYVPPGAAPSLEALRTRSSTLGNTPATTLDLPVEKSPTRSGSQILSNLTASLSKSSLTSFTGSERKPSQQPVLSRKTSSSSTFASDAPTRTATPTTPDVNPLIVTTAQPSSYWTGRFLSLQDRFQGESLRDKTLSTFVAAHASKATVLAQQREVYRGRGNLPLSTTTALDRYGTAAIREAERLSDEDSRCLRIFLHLDTLCGTPEAQKSLHAWQEAYARRMRRDALLPQGTSMDKGFVARLFSGSSRRSLGASRSGKETTKGKQILSAF